MKRLVSTLGIVIALLGVSEVLASMGVWSGKPMDGTWEPSFWSYEIARLHYWLPLVTAAVGVSLIVAIATLRWGKSPTLSFLLLSSAAAEYCASVLFRQSLPANEAAYLGWSYQPRYVSDHLWSWLISVSVLGATLAFLFWRRHRLEQLLNG